MKRRPNHIGISHPQSKQNPEQAYETRNAQDYPMARTALLTLQRNPIKDKSFSNFISFTFVTVVLLEILINKILTKLYSIKSTWLNQLFYFIS